MSAAAWKAPSATADNDRISKMMHEYESMNQSQKLEIAHAKVLQEAQANKYAELEKANRALLKKFKALESSQKYEKIASDGMTKKFRLLEVETGQLRYTKESLTKELQECKEKNKKLEIQVNGDRAERLQLMHENELLTKENVELRAKDQNSEFDSVEARTALLLKLQQFETVVSMNKAQQTTIEAQSEEIISLSNEIYVLRERMVHLNEQIMNHNQISAGFNKTVDILQAEIFRLRKEIIGNAHTKTDASQAFSASSNSSKLSSRISTTFIRKTATANNLSNTRKDLLHTMVGDTLGGNGRKSSAASIGDSTFQTEFSHMNSLSPSSQNTYPHRPATTTATSTAAAAAAGSDRRHSLRHPSSGRRTRSNSRDRSESGSLADRSTGDSVSAVPKSAHSTAAAGGGSIRFDIPGENGDLSYGDHANYSRGYGGGARGGDGGDASVLTLPSEYAASEALGEGGDKKPNTGVAYYSRDGMESFFSDFAASSSSTAALSTQESCSPSKNRTRSRSPQQQRTNTVRIGLKHGFLGEDGQRSALLSQLDAQQRKIEYNFDHSGNIFSPLPNPTTLGSSGSGSSVVSTSSAKSSVKQGSSSKIARGNSSMMVSPIATLHRPLTVKPLSSGSNSTVSTNSSHIVEERNGNVLHSIKKIKKSYSSPLISPVKLESTAAAAAAAAGGSIGKKPSLGKMPQIGSHSAGTNCNCSSGNGSQKPPRIPSPDPKGGFSTASGSNGGVTMETISSDTITGVSGGIDDADVGSKKGLAQTLPPPHSLHSPTQHFSPSQSPSSSPYSTHSPHTISGRVIHSSSGRSGKTTGVSGHGNAKSGRSSLLNSTKKTMYVGSGLGMKQNAQLEKELQSVSKGSTKQMLKKILGDKFDS